MEEEKEVPEDIDRVAQEEDMVREVQDRHAHIIMCRDRMVTDRHHHQDIITTIIITDHTEAHPVLPWQHSSLF